MPYADPIKRAECKRKWRENNREKDRACKLAHYHRNKEQYKEYRQLEYVQQARKDCLERRRLSGKKKASDKQYYLENKGKFKANSKLRKHLKLLATPMWARSGKIRKKIEEIYINCPEGFHVDHIVPIKNKMICGLHVPWNLQYLSAEENLRKSNKFLTVNTRIVL
jgi:hypothetical protein